MKKIFALFIAFCMVCGCFAACSASEPASNAAPPVLTVVETTEAKLEYAPNVPFEFDELEITIGDTVEFTTVDNQFSDLYGKDVCRVPITVKNISNNTHGLNLFYVSYYDATSKLDSVAFYFDDSIEQAGDLRSGASYTSYMYFPYTEAGNYMIQFSMLIGDPIEIELYISK